MRFGGLALLIVALGVASCDDSDGPSSPGTLIVSTSTTGNHPDQDGYLLTVDGASSLTLGPTDSIETVLPTGRHDLRLLGVAEHCSVEPDLSVAIRIEASTATPVAFDISCQATGAVVSAVTSGVDLDPDGYRVVVDGVGREAVLPNSTALVLLGAGSRTIMLQGLAGNCAMDGPASHTVTVEQATVVPVEFGVACTATTGTIGVFLADGEVEGVHAVRVDGGSQIDVSVEAPAYVSGVSPGEHVVTIASPAHCSAEHDAHSVTVSAGGLVRDTAEVIFEVTCEPTRFRITAPTTGQLPLSDYGVWGCDTSVYYCFYDFYYGQTGHVEFLDFLAPNGTLFQPVTPEHVYYLELQVPETCHAEVPSTSIVAPAPGDTLDVEFTVACSP
ncbi:MAG TPA: hypothetical protein VF061_12280 [Gemmatimonadales bacterium]